MMNIVENPTCIKPMLGVVLLEDCLKSVVPYGDEFISIWFNNKFSYLFSLRKNVGQDWVRPPDYYGDFFYDLEKSRKMKLKQIK